MPRLRPLLLAALLLAALAGPPATAQTWAPPDPAGHLWALLADLFHKVVGFQGVYPDPYGRSGSPPEGGAPASAVGALPDSPTGSGRVVGFQGVYSDPWGRSGSPPEGGEPASAAGASPDSSTGSGRVVGFQGSYPDPYGRSGSPPEGGEPASAAGALPDSPTGSGF